MDKEKSAYESLKRGIILYIDEVMKKTSHNSSDITKSAIIKKINGNLYDISLNNKIYYNVATIGGTCVENEIVKVLICQGNYNDMIILKA